MSRNIYTPLVKYFLQKIYSSVIQTNQKKSQQRKVKTKNEMKFKKQSLQNRAIQICKNNLNSLTDKYADKNLKYETPYHNV